MRTMYKILGIKAGILLSVFALLFATSGCTDDEQSASVSATAEEILINNTATTVPVTIRATTSWTAKSDQEWCYISQESGMGTTEVFIMAGDLTSDLKRTANITITPAAGKPWTIKVTQLPAKDTGVSVAPGMITMNAAASTGNSFTVKVQHAAAVVTATTTSTWIKTLVPAGNSTGQKSYFYTFNTDEYTGAAEREATITVTVRFGQHVYTETVNVIQNGLGAPAISTPANVYLNHNAVSHEQNIWVEGGNQANVTYALYITANESGSNQLPEPTPIANDVTVSNGTNPAISESWIKGAVITNGVLTVTTAANNFDEIREGDILIVAFRDEMTTKLNVHVAQASHRTPGLDLKNSVITHNSEEAFGASFLLNPVNNSEITTVNAGNLPVWIDNFEIAPDFKSFNYDIEGYDGSEGNYREASIILKADNGHANPAYYTLTIRQYAPSAPSISTPVSVITHPSTALSGSSFIMTQNGTQLSVPNAGAAYGWLTSLQIEQPTGADVWTLSYEMNAYDGSEGPFREIVVPIMASTDHESRAIYYITIRQYAPAAPGISNLPSRISLPANGTAGAAVTLPLGLLNGTTAAMLSVDANTPAWIGASIVGGNLNYNVAAYAGAADVLWREGVITIVADKGNGNKAYYYVTVRQYSPSAPGISDLPSFIGLTANGTAGAAVTLPLNLLNGTTAAMLSIDANTPTWIGASIVNGNLSYNVAAYTGATAALWREGVITIVADKGNGNKAYYYVTVRQYGDQFATLNPASISINASSFVATDFNVALQTIVSGSYISAINVTSLTNAGWGFVGGCSNNPTLIENFILASSFQPTSLNLRIGGVTLGDATAGHGMQRWGFVYVTVVNGLYSQIITLPVSQTIVNP